MFSESSKDFYCDVSLHKYNCKVRNATWWSKVMSEKAKNKRNQMFDPQLCLDHSAVAPSSLRCLTGPVAQRDFQAGVIS